MTDPWSVIEAALRDAGAGWSLGSFGAVAEFHQDPGEPAQVEAPLARAELRELFQSLTPLVVYSAA